MIEELFSDTLFIHNNYYNITVIKTNIINDKILTFGDLQDHEDLNNIVINNVLEILVQFLNSENIDLTLKIIKKSNK